MIHFSADIVLAVRDGFTGKPIAQSALMCTLDSLSYRPLMKPGGYIVFTNLSEGEHEIVLRGAMYRDEHLRLNVVKGHSLDKAVSMKPSEKYPFSKSVTRLALTVKKNGSPVSGGEIWIASTGSLFEIKIAQDSVPAGEKHSRLFSRDKKILSQLPAAYLVCDSKSSEIVEIAELTDENGVFEAPLAFSHKRGCTLNPAQKYTCDDSGVVNLVFSEKGKIIVFSPDSVTLTEIDLDNGQSTATVSL